MKKYAVLQKDAIGGYLLLLCAVASLVLANVGFGERYLDFWNRSMLGHPVSHWIDDGLMAVFFLFVGLEIKREMLVGTLSTWRRSILPLAAAVGGMLLPATIYLLVNYGKPSSLGFGIPMSTDIAFVVGILALLGSRVPASLKTFLLTLAVVDDIGAVLVIAIFYTSSIDVVFIVAALLLFVVMLWLNKSRHVDALWLYLALGIVLWALIMASGVHATIAGVLTAVAMPYRDGGEKRPAVRAERWLHLPVYWLILPLFVLSNTAVVLSGTMLSGLFNPHALGIMAGLLIGKPLGIFMMSWLVIVVGLAEMPAEMNWHHLLAAGCLGGIGFTMSIFIATLSFDNPMMVDSAKIAILLSSAAAAVIGVVLLARSGISTNRA